MDAAEHDYRPDPATIARRSISIFSRRGTETPEARPSFVNQSTMARTPTKLLNERQRGWLRRRSLDSGKAGGSPKKTKGTILKAVPPAETIRMTRLEEEMATSPNEEIVSAISERSPDILDFYTSSREASPTQRTFATASPIRGGWAQDSQSPRLRSGGAKRRDSQDRIGIWVDGVVHWDPKTAIQHMVLEYQEHMFEEETRFTPLRPAALNPRSTWRPSLTVTIPQSQPLISDPSLLINSEAQPQKPSIAPAEIVNRFPVAPSQVGVEEFPSRDVSPLETATSKQASQGNSIADSSEDEHATESEGDNTNNKQHRTSSSTASSFTDHDESSTYSKRSSATSIDATQTTATKDFAALELHSDSGDAFSLINPGDAGVFDDARSMAHAANVNKPLPRVPTPRDMRPAPGPPSAFGKSACSRPLRSTRSAPGSRKTGNIELRPMSAQALGNARSLSRLDLVDAEFMRSSPYTPATSDKAFDIESPTLSQAEDELEVHLSTISEDQKDEVIAENKDFDEQPSDTDVVAPERSSSVRSVMQPPSRAPTLPKRSRKREWRNALRTDSSAPSQTLQPSPQSPTRRRSDPAMLRAGVVSEDNFDESSLCPNVRRSASTLALQRVLSYAQSDNAQTAVADLSKSVGLGITYDDGLCVVSGPTIMRAAFRAAVTDVQAAANASKAAAEDVLLKILGALTSLDDLFNTASINKGMHRVFKENEMDLIRAVVQNQSPAGWEFREWCPPSRANEADDTSSKASSQLEHTPASYLACQKRDLETIQQLKLLVLGKCHTFIRRETAFALSTPSHPHSQRYTDAFWRIWAFCTIFGSQKGREDDITGQVDWLKGGLLANNQGFSATVNTNLEFDMGSVLLNAPDHFAQGNRGGLTAGQLYDMTEIWTCLATLLAPYQNCTLQASDSGVFDNCEIQQGDVEREEHMLEEWTAYLLSLGPSAVLEMAQLASDPAVGFAVAKENGWTQWTPPMYNNSRTTFLKEPVSRLYEERVAAAAQKLRNPREVEKKEMSRKRVATLAAEIRLARQSSAYKRLPLIDMNSERPMSMVSRRSTANTVRSIASARASMVVAPPLHMHPAFAQSPVEPSARPSPALSGLSTPRPTSPTNQWSPRKISPIIEDRVEAFNRLSIAKLDGMADSTVERAVKKITDMGFTEAQAKHALKKTDMGDGLRVDRAVDLLLRAC